MIKDLLSDYGFFCSGIVTLKIFDVYKANKIKINEINIILAAIFIYMTAYQLGTIRWVIQDLQKTVGESESLLWHCIDITGFIAFFIVLIVLKRLIKIFENLTYDNCN